MSNIEKLRKFHNAAVAAKEPGYDGMAARITDALLTVAEAAKRLIDVIDNESTSQRPAQVHIDNLVADDVVQALAALEAVKL